MKTITKQQARQFILSKQGLIGEHRFIGKDGAYLYVRQAGCIQYDPVDVWWEDGIRRTGKFDAALTQTVKKYAKFNDCNVIEYQ